jgi:chromosome segregation ATPase
MNKAALTILLLLAAPAEGQSVYKWVDENGEVHYSQTLPPERAGQAHDRLTNDGLLAERVDRVKTAEELAELKAEQAERKEQAEQRRIQAQQDRLFLAAFPTEQDVRQSIQSRRQAVIAELDSVRSLIEQGRARFAARVERAAALERRGEPVPDALVEYIASDRAAIRELNDRLDRINARLDALDQELSAELQRHRRLTDSG